eukprot:20598-Chlamydomonas_euryale.AAC.1
MPFSRWCVEASKALLTCRRQRGLALLTCRRSLLQMRVRPAQGDKAQQAAIGMQHKLKVTKHNKKR